MTDVAHAQTDTIAAARNQDGALAGSINPLAL